MTPYVINVSGAERHDGEKPYTVVVEADSMAQAKRAAWLWFVWNIASECGTVAADGNVPGRPDLDRPFPVHNDEVVVIDCPEFPCHAGVPFPCSDPCHYQKDVREPGPSCRCAFHWYYAHDEKPMDRHRLRQLGYATPVSIPEETLW
jgi:hypothetical protein